MESVFRGIAIYLIMMLIMRLSGRRTMAQMTPFDFILLLIVAETTQQALLGDDYSITNAAVLIVTLFGMDVLFSYVKAWVPWLGKAMNGDPTILIHDGEIDERALRRARVDLKDVMAAARSAHGLERLAQVKHAVLETDSGISITPRER